MKKSLMCMLIIGLLVLIVAILSGSANSFKLSITNDEGDIIFYKEYPLKFGVKSKIKLLYHGDALEYVAGFNTDKEAFCGLNDELYGDLCALKDERKIPPKNACVASFRNENFTYQKEKNGSLTDLHALKNDIFEHFDSEISAKETRKTLTPSLTLKKLKAVTQPLGSFCSQYENSSDGRKGNIALAASRLNNSLLAPDEKLSFNAIVGERTAENGFFNAKVIENGKFTEGIGGGVCQVSTTLYNAAVLSGLRIVEVHRHSLPVSYVNPSQDAMVSRYADLVAENISPYPCYIFAYADGKTISVKIYGQHAFGGLSARLRSETLSALTTDEYEDQFGTIYNGIPEGKTVLLPPTDGLESVAFLDLYHGNICVASKQIRHDFYKPRRGLVAS